MENKVRQPKTSVQRKRSVKNVAKLVLLGFAFIGSLVVYPLEYLFGLARKGKAAAPISFSLEGAVGFVDGIAQELDFGFNFLNEQIEKGINKIPRIARLSKGNRLWFQDSISQGDFEAYTRELKAVSVLATKLLVAVSFFSLRWTRKKIEVFVNQLVTQSINYGKLLKVFHEDTNTNPLDASTGYYEAYGYDTEGRQTEVKKPVELPSGVVEVVTETTYVDGRVASVIMDQSDPNNTTFAFGYNDDGDRESVI